MTPGDIQQIEKQTGLELPQCYIDVVTNYPAALLDSDAQDFGLLNDPQQIIEANNLVRESGYFGEVWPDHYFIIGHNGCGDYYVTLLGAEEFSVGFSDHEQMRCDPYANTLNEFIEKYLDGSKAET